MKISTIILCIILFIINANELIAKKLMKINKKTCTIVQVLLLKFGLHYELEEVFKFGLKVSKTLEVSSSTPSL